MGHIRLESRIWILSVGAGSPGMERGRGHRGSEAGGRCAHEKVFARRRETVASRRHLWRGGYAREIPLRDAVRFGMAAGAAAVMTEGTQLCTREDTEQLFERMKDGGK